MIKKNKIQLSFFVLSLIILGGLTYINMKEDNFEKQKYKEKQAQLIQNELQHLSVISISQEKADQIKQRVEKLTPECIESRDECEEWDAYTESDRGIARRVERYKPRENIVPYDITLLPVQPDQKENNATVMGIDSNQNGVRDDQEHRIVEHFGEDKELVEAMFAGQRLFQQELEYSENEQFDEETIKKSIYNTAMIVSCESDLFKTSSKYYNPRLNNSYAISTRRISETNVNTYDRVQLEREFGKKFHGRVSKSVNPTMDECKQFFESTKL